VNPSATRGARLAPVGGLVMWAVIGFVPAARLGVAPMAQSGARGELLPRIGLLWRFRRRRSGRVGLAVRAQA
jgi:hypothetical protein